MERRVYFVQPSYRDKDGTLLKGRRQGLHSAVLPALRAAVPGHWEKASCIEFFQDVDLETDASVVAITSMGYDFPRGRELAREFKRRGKIVLFGGWQAALSSGKLEGICDALVLGNPGPSALGRILDDAEAGRLAAEYRCGVEIDYPWEVILDASDAGGSAGTVPTGNIPADGSGINMNVWERTTFESGEFRILPPQ